MTTSNAFNAFTFIGADAQKFLQGQVTVHVERLDIASTRYTTICDLKGRVQFGLWLSKISDEQLDIVVTQDQAADFAAHIKKFAAFSKAKLEDKGTVYPRIENAETIFVTEQTDVHTWEKQAIELGLAWITTTTTHLFQPQELRLHQRHGIDYDKGCYLGQEVIARLWFKAKPKAWLHLISGTGEVPAPASQLHAQVQVVNSIATDTGYIALVIARPEALTELDIQVLDLPEMLSGDVARPK